MTVATPKSSSAALQLPFILFGLGETPNFIQELTVGTIVRVTVGEINNSTTEVRYRKWKNLVPNSQIIVIPNPPNDPGRYVCTVDTVNKSIIHVILTIQWNLSNRTFRERDTVLNISLQWTKLNPQILTPPNAIGIS